MVNQPKVIGVAWKKGAKMKTPADKAYAEVERIRTKNGGVFNAADLVEESRAKRAPLHNEFPWDDAVAAHEHRLAIARKIGRSIEVTFEEAPARPTRAYETRVVQRVTNDGKSTKEKREYLAVEDILAEPTSRDELLARARRELASFKRRYAVLEELSGVFSAIDETLAA